MKSTVRICSAQFYNWRGLRALNCIMQDELEEFQLDEPLGTAVKSLKG